MSRYYLKGKNPRDELCIGVDRARFIFVHFNEDRIQSAYDSGRELPPESKAWIRDFHFGATYDVEGFGRSPALFAALDAARSVAHVPDELAAIIREDFRIATGEKKYNRQDVDELTRRARALPGVSSASYAGL